MSSAKTTTLSPVKQAYLALQRAERKIAELEARLAPEPIAIVGLSARYPSSRDIAELWGHLAAGRDLVTEAARWDFSHVDPELSYCRQGGFLDDIDRFDPQFFNLSGTEASYMDPQQRIFLEEAWKALEDAGYAGSAIEGSCCGVYVGCYGGDYNSLIPSGDRTVPAQAMWGTAASILPARISYLLNLKGPALAIDTACSSSLVAIHLACEALWSHEIDTAIAGGVFIQCTSAYYLSANRAGMLSKSGRCNTFDRNADGFIPSEGAGVVVLKRLSDALAKGDHIHGVIRGSAINQDGATNGITAPSALSQESLEREVYDKFKINPEHITMVEAHGTGTSLGDPIEVRALTKAFRSYTASNQYCAIGSIKTNLGHAATAAGVAGVIKILLAMKHRKIPPSLHFTLQNPEIPFETSPFYVNTSLRDWESEGKRCAAVSSFGFSGTNAHLVLEEAPPTQRCHTPRPAYLLTCSARTPEQLREQVVRLVSHFKQTPNLDCGDVSHTLLLGRKHLPQRLACVVHTIDQAIESMLQWLDLGRDPHVVVSAKPEGHTPLKNALKRYCDQCISECLTPLPPEEYIERLRTVAELHIQGYLPDFAPLFSGDTYKRVPLPTYPFAQERYWIETPKASLSPNAKLVNSAPSPDKKNASSVIHPLLHRRIESTTSAQLFSSTFTGNEFFLSEHVIRGKCVLPGVAYLEMARVAVTQIYAEPNCPPQVVRLKNLVWSRPLTAAGKPITVNIALKQAEQPAEIQFEIFTPSTNGNILRNEIHVPGSASIFEAGERVHIDVAALLASCNRVLSGEQFYEVFRKIDVYHGPSYQGIRTVAIGEESGTQPFALADLEVPECARADPDDYTLHPGLMDSALQAMMGLMLAGGTGRTIANPFIPFALQEVEILAACPMRAWAWLRYAAGSGPLSPIQQLDIDICDREGLVCVRLRGLTVREVEGTLGKTDEDSLLAASVWTPLELNDNQTPKQERLLILCGFGSHSVYNLSMNAVEGTRATIIGLEGAAVENFELAALELLYALQNISHTETDQNTLLQVIIPGDDRSALLFGLGGLLRTAALENRKLNWQVVQVDSADSVETTLERLQSVWSDGRQGCIRFVGSRTYGQEWQELVQNEIGANGSMPWRDDGVYLITGGAGGLGTIFAEEILQRTAQSHVIVCGRSAPNTIQATTFANYGPRLEYRQLDVSHSRETDDLIKAIQLEHGRLNGILHCAGITRDRLILNKSQQELREVFAPKVRGAVNIDEAARTVDLDFLVLFGSMAGVLGNVGQADYAAANAFMAEYANVRNASIASGVRRGRTICIDWPTWTEGGMRISGAAEQSLRATLGVTPLSRTRGLRAFYMAFESPFSHIFVVEGRLRQLQKRLLGNQPDAGPVKREEARHATTDIRTWNVDFSQQVESEVIRSAASLLRLKKEAINPEVQLGELGFDSIMLTEFSEALWSDFGLRVLPTLFFEFSTLRSLARYLTKEFPEIWSSRLASAPVAISSGVTEPPATDGHPEDPVPIQPTQAVSSQNVVPDGRPSKPESIAVAVIGMSGKFPQAKNLDEFWNNLITGRDCITEIPTTRWDWRQYDGDPHKEENKTNVKWGGFIDGIDEFDASFFGVSRREAELMDPQQRLLMTYLWSAMEDAGYSSESLAGSDTAIFVGTGSVGYGELVSRCNIPTEAQTFTGSVPSLGPNRMSYMLDLHGPSEPVETACSSSLVAFHRAAQMIKSGRSEMAFAGGVNTILLPEIYVSLSKAGMLAEDGRCKTFSSQANGFARGEGVGMLLLKALSAAERDGDHIYGLIRGSAENHGGRASSLTAPNPAAQDALIREAFKAGGVDPRSVTYIEAHGTGTPLGDPIEIGALKTSFAHLYDLRGEKIEGKHCGLGSVKTNIGHLELAAGAASVIKVLLQIKHGFLAKSLHCDVISPYIELENTPFFVVQHPQPWTRLKDAAGCEMPRAAGISSFGFGGVNAHVIVEEYVAPNVHASASTSLIVQPYIIVLSAKTSAALKRMSENMLQCIAAGQLGAGDLSSVAYTLQVGRDAMNFRLAFLASTLDDITYKLTEFLKDLPQNDLFHGTLKQSSDTLSLGATKEELDRLMADSVRRGDLRTISELWTKGAAVDWRIFHRDIMPRRISLPTYPFAKDRFWIAEPSQKIPSSVSPGIKPVLHPLVHANVSTFERQEFVSTFTGNEFFLEDHVIRGKKILSGAAYLEMALVAERQSTGTKTWVQDGSFVPSRLTEVAWERPLIVAQAPVAMSIRLKQERECKVEFEVVTHDGPDKTRVRTHSRGYVSAATPGVAAGNIDLAAELDTCKLKTISAEACYRAFNGMQINYGPAHRGLKEIHVGRSFDGQLHAIARLQLPDRVRTPDDRYILHPSLIDSAFQAVIGVLAEHVDLEAGSPSPKNFLAFSLDLVEVLAPSPQDGWVLVRHNRRRQISTQFPKVDLDLCDDTGRVCVRFEGLTCRVGELTPEVNLVHASEVSRGSRLEIPVGAVTMVPGWEPLLASFAKEQNANAGQLLLIGGTLEQRLTVFNLRPDAVSIDLELSDTVNVIAGRLKSSPGFDCLLLIVPSPSVSLEQEAEQVDKTATVTYCFRLAKALLQNGLGERSFHWIVVTTTDSSALSLAPSNAAVHGFLGTLANEYPNWALRGVDCISAVELPVADIFSSTQLQKNDIRLYRRGQWYNQQLYFYKGQPLGKNLFRFGGVYLIIGGSGRVGELLSESLIRSYGARIVWLGRRERDQLINAKIARLASFGHPPDYIRADVTLPLDLDVAYHEVLRRYGVLDGVMHLAMSASSQSVADMTESEFSSNLSAKILGSFRVASLFRDKPLDFLVFFSSIVSFAKNAHQAPYTTGSNFQDAFAVELAQRTSYPVRVINWGYWSGMDSTLGELQNRLIQLGVDFIEPDEALEFLTKAILNPSPQSLFLKTNKAEALNNLGLRPNRIESVVNLAQDHEFIAHLLPRESGRNGEAAALLQEKEMRFGTFNRILLELVAGQLQQLGYLNGKSALQSVTVPLYSRWLEKTLALLSEQGLLGDSDSTASSAPSLETSWDRWDEFKTSLPNDSYLRGHAALLDVTLGALSEILRGQCSATDILFAEAVLPLLEAVYKNNSLAAYFNDVLADSVATYIDQLAAKGSARRIRIIEIGAGTGSATEVVTRRIDGAAPHIEEYLFTDISKAFMLRAEESFGSLTFMKFRQLDIETPVVTQGFNLGQYDVVIASNVLHAVGDVRQAIRHAKSLLRKGGLLVLNELSSFSLPAHLTFGLLEGWWQYKDKATRIPGSPALAWETWRELLSEEGLHLISSPVYTIHALGQQILVAESDGLIRQSVKPKPDTSISGEESVKVSRDRATDHLAEEPKIETETAEQDHLSAGGRELLEHVRRIATQQLAIAVKVSETDIDIDESFADYGVDSILGIKVTQMIGSNLNLKLPVTALFDYPSIRRLSQHILRENAEALQELISSQAIPPASSKSISLPPGGMNSSQVRSIEQASNTVGPKSKETSTTKQPIAIIGLSGRYPKSVNVNELWQHLAAGDDMTSPVLRWPLTLEQGSTTSCPRGGFLEGIDLFDPMFFGISGSEAKYMDPQQRFFLQESWKALEDAGYVGSAIDSASCGVYVGCHAGSYLEVADPSIPPPPQMMWGNAVSVLASRISYFLNLHGPAMAIDTACSSSLVAIHLACQSLWAGDTQLALAGGVFIQCSPAFHVAASRAGMLSPTGSCHTFDEQADGFVPSEGVGAIVLKRLSDALADGDHIYAVIRGSGINQDGTTNGITAPSALSQERLQRQIYDSFHIDPEEITFVEAHGTGTKLGDPIEVKALTSAFRQYTGKRQFCSIGSIKSNMGHPAAAAGIAGLTKILLSFRHQQLPPSIHYQNGNPAIDFETSPFYVNRTLEPWQVSPSGKRIAAISSFGFSGTNAHLVLEEAPKREKPRMSQPCYLFVFSARTPRQLSDVIRNFSKYAVTVEDFDCADVSFTLVQGRKHFAHRAACVVRGRTELTELLLTWSEAPGQMGWCVGSVPPAEESERSPLIAIGNEQIERCLLTEEPAIYRNCLRAVADLYVRGLRLQYERLFSRGLYGRVSLPTYPFGDDHYWAGTSSEEQSLVAADVRSFHQIGLVPNGLKVKPYASRGLDAKHLVDAYEPLFFEEVEVPSPLVFAEGRTFRTILVLASDSESVESISKAIHAIDFSLTVILATPARGYEYLEPNRYSLLLEDYSNCLAILEDIRQRHKEIDVILNCLPLNDRKSVADVASIANLVRALSESRIPCKRLILAGNSKSDLESTYLDSWLGFERSARITLPNTIVSVVYEVLSAGDSPIALEHWGRRLWDELRDKNGLSSVYRHGIRYTYEITAAALDPKRQKLRHGGVYMITGGAGELGLTLADYLSSMYCAKLFLIGRKELAPEKLERLRAISRRGGEVQYITADVCDVDRMQEVMVHIQMQAGILNGIVHAAGVFENQEIRDKEIAGFRRVLAPKITGTIVLSKVAPMETLDFVCYFSSASAVLGDFGSCDYAIANRFQMKYAQHLAKTYPACRILSIQWPVWKDGGMGAGASPQSDLYLKSSHQRAVTNEEGVELFEKLLGQRGTHYLVIAGEPNHVHHFLGISSPFSRTVQQSASVMASQKRDSSVETVEHPALLTLVRSDIAAQVGGILMLAPEDLDERTNLADFGFDSLSLTELAKQLSSYFSIDLTPALFFTYSTIAQLAEHFIAKHKPVLTAHYRGAQGHANLMSATDRETESASPPKMQHVASTSQAPDVKGAHEPIAIVGMSGRFPEARTIEEFWNILAHGVTAVDEIPAERFDWREHFGDPNRDKGKMMSKWMGAVPGVTEFDPEFFEISRREAVDMDPRQRILLQESWNALEDAGYGTDRLSTANVGTFVGVEQGDYQLLVKDGASITSNHDGVLAARLAYFLNLSGPTMSINTACSSALVAAHQACLSLRAGDCDAAIVAGVNLVLTHDFYARMSDSGMLSPDGRCFAFDRRANGFVPAEAAVVVVLKRLSQAERDSDRIYAVIRGSGINYDGRTNGLTAPSGAAQASLLRDVYARYAVQANEIEYVVAHGTATRLGDPVEVEALCSAFESPTTERQFCAITSTKSNVGHTLAASGLVNLVTLVLALQHEAIPPSLHCEQESDYINWQESPFYINKQLKAWPRRGLRQRLGALSAFGMSGTNVHMVVSDVPDSSDRQRMSKQILPCVLLAISAKTERAMLDRVASLVEFLRRGAGDYRHLLLTSYTLLTRRIHLPHRCAVIAASVEEGIDLFEKILRAELSAQCFWGTASRDVDERSEWTQYGNQIIRQNSMQQGGEERYRNMLDTSAKLYCKGYHLDWYELFRHQDAIPICLPSYPFRKDRFWISPPKSEFSQLKAAESPPHSTADNTGNGAVQLEPRQRKAAQLRNLADYKLVNQNTEVPRREPVALRSLSPQPMPSAQTSCQEAAIASPTRQANGVISTISVTPRTNEGILLHRESFGGEELQPHLADAAVHHNGNNGHKSVVATPEKLQEKSSLVPLILEQVFDGSLEIEDAASLLTCI